MSNIKYRSMVDKIEEAIALAMEFLDEETEIKIRAYERYKAQTGKRVPPRRKISSNKK